MPSLRSWLYMGALPLPGCTRSLCVTLSPRSGCSGASATHAICTAYLRRWGVAMDQVGEVSMGRCPAVVWAIRWDSGAVEGIIVASQRSRFSTTTASETPPALIHSRKHAGLAVLIAHGHITYVSPGENAVCGASYHLCATPCISRGKCPISRRVHHLCT